MKNKVILVCSILLIASCFAKKQTSKSTSKALVPKKEISGDASVDEPKKEVAKVEIKKTISPVANNPEKLLAQGRALYQTKCNQCHDLKNEKSESEKGWRYHVPEMVDMANKASKPISQSESDLILAYLLNAIKD
jgi:mono/diheme cytochrome c family protein